MKRQRKAGQLGRKERRRLQSLAQQWQAPKREREPIIVKDPRHLRDAIREGVRRAEESARNLLGKP